MVARGLAKVPLPEASEPVVATYQSVRASDPQMTSKVTSASISMFPIEDVQFAVAQAGSNTSMQVSELSVASKVVNASVTPFLIFK